MLPARSSSAPVPWAKLDDEYPRHPKMQRIPAALRADAIALEVAGLCYSTRVLTDGFVAAAVVETLGLEVGFEHKRGLNRKRLRAVIGSLLDAKRWVSVPGGYQIHDYADYQPSASDVKEKRRLEREKKRKQRDQGRMSLALSPRDNTRDTEGLSPPLSPGDTSRALATGAGAPAHPDPSPTHEEQEQKSSSLSADRSETTANGLPFEKERVTAELLAAIGDDADKGTAQVVRSYAGQLPEGALAKVLESVASSKARDRAAYVVGALKDEVESRQPVPARSTALRKDPELYVREVGYKLPEDVLEEVLGDLVPDEDERIRLVDLAADLRREVTA